MNLERYFTKETKEYEYEKRDARIVDGEGNVIFEQKDVNVPKHWSDQAVNIFVSKYFNGKLNSEERETSIEDVLDRVAFTIADWGIEDGYFESPSDAAIFGGELFYLLYHQMGSFNSPVWFNLGIEESPNISACYINNVEDSMDSIMDLAKLEARIFKGGSGSGTNLSNLRASNEGLSRGGVSSGPVSFMKALDTFAGVIKSAGVKRRAAVLRSLDCDHPDILEFIQCKPKEEQKARDLISLGYDSSIDGDAYSTVAFQNANHCVRLSDDFMQAAEHNNTWDLVNRVDGEVVATEKANDILYEIAKASYDCGDPGIQFIDTINKANTLDIPIRSSNPCFTGDMKLLTVNGYESFAFLANEEVEVINRYGEVSKGKVVSTGKKRVLELVFTHDIEPIRCTPDHIFLLNNGDECEAKDLLGKRLLPYIRFRRYKNEGSFLRGVKTKNFKEDMIQESAYDNPDFINGYCTAKGFINKEREYGIADKNRDNLIELKSWLRSFFDIESYFTSDEFITKNKGNVLMISGFKNLKNFAENIGFSFIKHRAFFEKWFINNSPSIKIVQELGIESVYDFTEPLTHWGIVNGFVVHNCGEFLAPDNTSCNLASLNLVKFLELSDGSYNNTFWEPFSRAVQIFITAQEILIDRASYPSKAIEENSKKYRPLGLGFTNLGAFLMRLAIPYDSNEAREIVASITSLMTVSAYIQSTKLAEIKGSIKADGVKLVTYGMQNYDGMLKYTFASMWERFHNLREKYGVRNSQVTLLAPCGTISFIMDCDSTGIEPVFSLLKTKQLVGGGIIKSVCKSVEPALKRLGYKAGKIDNIKEYLENGEDICDLINTMDLNVFDCALPSKENGSCISVNGHIDMLSAVQPFLNGGISKTVNIPSSYTIDDIRDLYVEAWQKGLKSIIIYRDKSKAIQPMQVTSKNINSDKETSIMVYENNSRISLPDERAAINHKFSIAGHEGYLTVGLYENGSPGELFIKMSKAGSVVSGLVDSVALVTSMALQYGVPLKVLVDKFEHTRFEPSGFTGNSDIPIAKSIMDYVFRWLGNKFLNNNFEEDDDMEDEKQSLVVDTKFEPTQEDAQVCLDCGSIMCRQGSCFYCTNCGSSSGCS